MVEHFAPHLKDFLEAHQLRSAGLAHCNKSATKGSRQINTYINTTQAIQNLKRHNLKRPVFQFLDVKRASNTY